MCLPARRLRRSSSSRSTLFDSLDAVREFAGPQPERPVIEPEAKRLLARVGERVEHLDVAIAL
jgi:hypothetical protein